MFGRILFCILVGWAPSALAIDAIVVRPSSWASALTNWKQYRQSQGHEILELDSEIGRDAIQATVARNAEEQGGKLRYLLLAGDVGSGSKAIIPTFYHRSTAMVRFGGDPTIASDSSYGDIDMDGSPDLAIGRIPADSPDQLRGVLDRVVAFERKNDFSTWRRDVHVVAGVGGFGAVTDSIIEMTTRRFLADRIPGWSKVTMTQASLQSHYCPDPYQFSNTCISRMNQGGMFWVYIGHGHVQTLDHLRVGQRYLPIMTNKNVPAVDAGSRPPIAIFLACYTGAFDAPEDSLAEKLVLSNSGPIAALAASRVSGPYGLAMLSDGMLAGCFEKKIETLGGIILHAKQRLLDAELEQELNQEGNGQIKMIRSIAKALSPSDYDLHAEQLEHVLQMNLLGDPMIRLSQPRTLQLNMPQRAEPGDVLIVSGQSAASGKLMIEFAYRREQVRQDLNAFEVNSTTPQGREAHQLRYDQVNDGVIVSKSLDHSSGKFETPIEIPKNLKNGKYCVRAFLEHKSGWDAGYGEVSVRAPR